MTVSSVVIEPIKDLKNWFKITFKSQKNGIGETTTEMLVSGESLKSFRQQIDKAFGVKPDYSELPENLRKFTEDGTK